MTKLQALYKDIEKAKASIIKQAKRNGIYENIGEREARAVYDKHFAGKWFDDIDGAEKALLYGALESFQEWINTLDYNTIKRGAEK